MYKIAPQTMMVSAPEMHSSIDRNRFLGGCQIPPHMFRLTDWWGGESGQAIFLNAQTGNVVDLQEYEPTGCDIGKECPCTTFAGPEEPVEPFLRRWIGNYLTMNWIPDGSMDAMTPQWRSLTYLSHKKLMQEYGWPDSFPLPSPRFQKFLVRKKNLTDEDFQRYNSGNDLFRLWTDLTDRNIYSPSSSIGPHETDLVDSQISELIWKHHLRLSDHEYAAAANVPVLDYFVNPTILGEVTYVESGIPFHVTSEMYMSRFEEVVRLKPELVGKGTEEIREIIAAAVGAWWDENAPFDGMFGVARRPGWARQSTREVVVETATSMGEEHEPVKLVLKEEEVEVEL
jgi:hypothetical protein